MDFLRKIIRLEDLPAPLIRHLNGLWRRRWLVVATIWAAAMTGWFGVWLLPDRYESRAQVFVQTETILQPVLRGVTASPDYRDRVDVMRLQLLTRPNVEEIIYRAGLDQEIEETLPVERLAAMQSMVDSVAGKIAIENPRDMYFVIRYVHGDPETARRVADAVLNLLIEQDIGASLSESGAARVRLERQIEAYDERLSANELKVAQFRREHAVELAAVESAGRRRSLKESALVGVIDDINRTRGRILTLENLLSATPRGASGGELERLRVELADLRSRYRENHPDIRGVVARIKELEREDGALAANPEYIRLQSELKVAQTSLAALEGRQITLRNELEALDIAAGQAPTVVAELQQIERQYATTKKTYEDLLERRDRLQLTENLGPAGGAGVNYQVFERPERALRPIAPPRQLLIYATILGAIGVGIGVGVMINVIDRSFTQSQELEQAFGLPVLGAFTEAPSVEIHAMRKRDRLHLIGALAGLATMALFYSYLTVERLPTDLGDSAAMYNNRQEAVR